MLHLLILLLGELSPFLTLPAKLSTVCILFSLILSLLPIYTVIIVLMMLYCNAYLFPIKPGVL